MQLTKQICNAFSKSADTYEQSALVQREIGERLISRLDYVKINPARILDLGCATGVFSAALKKRYPKADIVGLDLSHKMVTQAWQKQTWRRKWQLACGDMMRLPFASDSFDLIFSNQVVHWAISMPELFQELSRVMRTGGCLFFSTLGPDTFFELKQAWSLTDNYSHVNDFADMHDVGDQLLMAELEDPVVDMEKLVVRYQDPISVLRAQGVKNINFNRRRGLTGKLAWKNFMTNFKAQSVEGRYPLTYEVVYGHAWKAEKTLQNQNGETMISVDALRKQLKKSHL